MLSIEHSFNTYLLSIYYIKDTDTDVEVRAINETLDRYYFTDDDPGGESDLEHFTLQFVTIIAGPLKVKCKELKGVYDQVWKIIEFFPKINK